MRLGYHYHVPALLKENSLWTPGYHGIFLDSLAAHCHSLTCFLHQPRTDEVETLDYRIKSTNISMVPLGVRPSIPGRLLKSAQYKKIFQAFSADVDAVLVRCPTPILSVLHEALPAVPLVLLIVGDYLAGVDALSQSWLRREAIRCWARWNKAEQNRIAKEAQVFVNSRILQRELSGIVRRLEEIKTTTLRKEDFFVRRDTCGKAPFRIFYSGRITRGKGLNDLLEAVAILISKGEDVVLDLAGPQEPRENLWEELKAQAVRQGIASRVTYHGYRPLGESLFSLYKAADVFVMPSRTLSEGFPRCIWEALAHSLPVVATDVGSVREYVGTVASIVPPSEPELLAGAIQEIIHDAGLRQGRIRDGLETVSTVTVEEQARKMMERIKGWLHEPASKT